jgi:acetolactate synthase-1/2/3 large subunit
VLGYQKDAEDCRHGRHTDACYFQPVDHAAVARACGAMGLRVERAADYAAALREAIEADVPCVIDVVTDPMAYPPLTAFDDKLESVRAARTQPVAAGAASVR